MFKIQKVIDGAFDFIGNHKTEIIAAVIGVGTIALYSASFDRGYECRKSMEEACDADTGSNIIQTLKEYDE